jgi:hypothetical protein
LTTSSIAPEDRDRLRAPQVQVFAVGAVIWVVCAGVFAIIDTTTWCAPRGAPAGPPSRSDRWRDRLPQLIRVLPADVDQLLHAVDG